VAPVLAPVVALAVIGLVTLVLSVQRTSQRRLIGRAVGHGAAGPPRILYFTGENCTVCHVAQRPALRRLRDAVADLDVREIDVAADPRAARAYRVMTLPTTVVLDGGGRVTAVNAGFASEATLRTQLESARVLAAENAVA
jgi:thiol-disulfide isomerase/thioredoxin